MKKILTIFLLFATLNLFSQAPDIASQKTLGGTNYDHAASIQQTADGGFIIAGSAASTDGDVTANNGSFDVWIVKLTSNNNVQWKKSYGGSKYDYASAVQQTTDGGYIVAGYTFSNDGNVSGNHGKYDWWVMKLSSSGNILFKKCFGGAGQDIASAVQQTADGGFIVAGYSDSNDGDVTSNHGGYDYWVTKLDGTGTLQWQASFGGAGQDIATSVKQASDGGYVVAGYSDSNNGNVTGNHGGDDFWIVKLDSNGGLEWQNSYGGSGNDMANALQTITAGGLIVAGTYQVADGDIVGEHTNDYWILKLSNTGVILWQKSLGGKGDDVANAVQLTTDGGFIIGGSSSSKDGDISSYKGVDDYWVLKLKGNGTLLWEKNLGGSGSDVARSVQQTADGGYVVAGSTASANGDVNGFHGINSFVNYDDYWIVKLYEESEVIVTAEPGTNICEGTPVLFTATLAASIVGPDYEWKKNGVVVGDNSDEYIDSTMQTGDSVVCTITEGSVTRKSNTLRFTVNDKITPAISISANPSTSVCFGTLIVFTATAMNGGELPVYQWYKNGTTVGTNTTIYRDSMLNNNDTIWCVLTTSESCVTATTAISNKINAVVISKTPTISVTASKTSTCPQEVITFTATIANGGTTPIYQWRKNNMNVGTNNPVFSSSVNNNDSVYCILTSNDVCLTTNGVTSNKVKITVTSNLVVSVNVSSNVSSPVCDGTTVVFSATPVNGGSAPIFQWKKNGVNVGTNSPTFTTSSLVNDDTIYCVLTSNVCTTVPTKTSNKIRFTVTPVVTPTISISANTGAVVCTGAKVTFSATVTYAGMTPVYQWRKNGAIVGTNSRTYVDSTLANGDAILCKLTSSMSCVTPPGPIASNTITMTVGVMLTPTISVSSNPASPICQGVLPTLTATITNGGISQTYQWKKNSVNVGTNSPTYTPAAVVTNDTIWCELTSNSGCAITTVKSNKIRFTVNPAINASISITANNSTTICGGTKVTFTATPTNGGTPPSYQWKKNGINVGTNAKTYSDTTLKTNDTIYCMLTSTAACVTNPTVKSNKFVFTVNPVVKPTISIVADHTSPICLGTAVKFTATITNGGSNPRYDWKKNGVIVGTNSATYTDNTLNTNDTIYCYLTSNAPCAAPVSLNSNKIRFTVNAIAAMPSAITGPLDVTANLKNIYFSVANVVGVTNVWTVPSGVTIVSGQGTEKIKVNWGTLSGPMEVSATNDCGTSINKSSMHVSVVSTVKGIGTTTDEARYGTQWSVYPNPTVAVATFSIVCSTDQKYVIEVSDAVGKVLLSKTGYTYKGANALNIDLAKYTAGMYYLRYTDKEHGMLVSRVIKSD